MNFNVGHMVFLFRFCVMSCLFVVPCVYGGDQDDLTLKIDPIYLKLTSLIDARCAPFKKVTDEKTYEEWRSSVQSVCTEFYKGHRLQVCKVVFSKPIKLETASKEELEELIGLYSELYPITDKLNALSDKHFEKNPHAQKLYEMMFKENGRMDFELGLDLTLNALHCAAVAKGSTMEIPERAKDVSKRGLPAIQKIREKYGKTETSGLSPTPEIAKDTPTAVEKPVPSPPTAPDSPRPLPRPQSAPVQPRPVVVPPPISKVDTAENFGLGPLNGPWVSNPDALEMWGQICQVDTPAVMISAYSIARDIRDWQKNMYRTKREPSEAQILEKRRELALRLWSLLTTAQRRNESCRSTTAQYDFYSFIAQW